MTPDVLLEIIGKRLGKMEAEIYNALHKRDHDIADVDLRLVSLTAAVELIDPEPDPGEPGKPGPPGEEGPPGEPGRPGVDGVSLAFLGKWSDELEYRRGDVVAWEGASWGCKSATAAGDEPGTCDHWEVMALRGNRGRPGEKGDKGDPGRPGQAVKLVACNIVEATCLAFADEEGNLFSVDLAPMVAAIGAAVEHELEQRLEAIETALTRAKML